MGLDLFFLSVSCTVAVVVRKRDGKVSFHATRDPERLLNFRLCVLKWIQILVLCSSRLMTGQEESLQAGEGAPWVKCLL